MGAVVVRVAIVSGPVADAGVGRPKSVLADHVLRSAEAHRAADQLGMEAPDGDDGHARVPSDLGGGIRCVWDGCWVLHVRAFPPPMCSALQIDAIDMCLARACDRAIGNIVLTEAHYRR